MKYSTVRTDCACKLIIWHKPAVDEYNKDWRMWECEGCGYTFPYMFYARKHRCLGRLACYYQHQELI